MCLSRQILSMKYAQEDGSWLCKGPEKANLGDKNMPMGIIPIKPKARDTTFDSAYDSVSSTKVERWETFQRTRRNLIRISLVDAEV